MSGNGIWPRTGKSDHIIMVFQEFLGAKNTLLLRKLRKYIQDAIIYLLFAGQDNITNSFC